MKKKIELPDELKPSKAMYENAKKIDEHYYKKMYEMLIKSGDNLTPSDAIELLAEITSMKIALQIGYGLSEYDIRKIKGIVERHIASILFLE